MKECTIENAGRPLSKALDLEKGYRTFDHDQVLAHDILTDDPDNPDSLGSNWMSRLDDDILLSALTIPGTHDSASYTSSVPFITTQNLSIPQQLALGIRYFDLRVGVRNNIAEMVHGVAYLNLTLTSVLQSMTTFLSTHPGEALLIQIKQDRKPSSSTIPFSHAIYLALNPIHPYLRTNPTTPSLGQCRGKIQLFRRYTGPNLRNYGINVTQWQDNPSIPFTISHPWIHQSLTIQDHYSFSAPLSLPSLINSKGADIAHLLRLASSDEDMSHWYINFTSAFEINVWYQIPPKTIAVGGYYFLRWVEGINDRVKAWMEEMGAGKRLGIVVMDFPEMGGKGELVEMLILSNFKKGEEGDDENEKRRIWRQCGIFLLVLVQIVLVLAALVFFWWLMLNEEGYFS